MKAMIRGIYTTALTKLLLDSGFEIVHPSPAIKKRFGLTDNFAPPDLKIRDRYDLQGVRALGTQAAVNALQSVLQSNFEDVLTRKWAVNVDGIYMGKVLESNKMITYVDLGNNILGKLPRNECFVASGEFIPVQVERRRLGAKQPILTTKLKIIGNYAILAQNSKVGVSLKIRDLSKRAELYATGKKLAPNGWGIIWREHSKDVSTEILEKEIKALAEKIEALKERLLKIQTPSLLIEGLIFMDVEFPCLTKKGLDKLRAQITPTIDGHHFYKCCGGKVSAALEMAEKALEQGRTENEIKELFKKQVAYEFPEEDSVVDVFHVKLSGRTLNLGQATIESIDNTHIKYNRIIRSEGVYDGLNIKKEAGDKAVSETKTGEWYIITKYFSPNGELKGTYININTPVEIYPKTIRYVDLEVDICITPDGKGKILDMEKLEKAMENGIISQRLFEKTKEVAQKIFATYCKEF
ncbi:MAG: DUF402 domain-containing protein [Candidatus Bathyarchaeia archaeon]